MSTPLLWEELVEADPAAFTIVPIWERVRRFGGFFAPVLRGGRRLDAAERALVFDPEG